jgi:thioredoxin-related protein
VLESLIPLGVNVSGGRDLALKFQIQYTPTTVVLDDEGKEHYRSVGFEPPQEYVPSLMLGIGRSYFDNHRFDKALAVFRRLLAEYPRSKAASTAAGLRDACVKKGAT